MPGDFDTVKERVDIVQLISERVPLKKVGRAYSGLCPFHSEKTPSFTVDPDRRTYHCFGCGLTGTGSPGPGRWDGPSLAKGWRTLAGGPGGGRPSGPGPRGGGRRTRARA